MGRSEVPPVRRCLWCDEELEGKKDGALFCDDAHRAKYKRAAKAAKLADIVERLEPFVSEDGEPVYRELVGHLAGAVNAR